MNFALVRHRLRTDFQLWVLTMMGLVALVGILPFALYRLLNEQWLVAGTDIAIVTGIVVMVLFAWRTGKTRLACQVLAYTNSLGGVIVAMTLGPPGAFWLFPLCASNFIIVERHHATAAAFVTLSILLIDGRLFSSWAMNASFIATLLVSCLLAYIFAHRSEVQRQQLEILAARDALTGVYNRRSFKEELERSHQSFERDGIQYGLLILDLDHFKRINDTWGHDAGDQVLIQLTRLVESSVRKTDRLFRYGGEEFALLVSSASFSSLVSIAESICQTVRMKLVYRNQKITVSIGGALLCPMEKADGWFARADAALYRAKKQGRDRAIIDGL